MDIAAPHAKDAETQAARGLHNLGEFYAQAAQNAAEYVQAFLDLPVRSIDEWQECQRTFIDWIGRTTELTARAARDLAYCRDLHQFTDVHRQFAQESRRHFVEASTHILDLSSRIADKVAAPIEDQAAKVAPRRRAAAPAAAA